MALGVSSMTFWCRRCTLHSRSPSQMASPCVSAKTWISMWCGGDHVLDHQVTLARRGRTNPHRFVARAHMQRGAIGIAVDGDGADAHLAAGARHADGDLATVCDEDLADGHSAASLARRTLPE